MNEMTVMNLDRHASRNTSHAKKAGKKTNKELLLNYQMTIRDWN